MNARDLRKWIAAEQRLCASGNWAEFACKDSALYRAEYQAHNAFEAEVLSLSADVNPLFRARGLLFRGKFHQSQTLLKEMMVQSREPILQAEVALERARLEAYLGSWQASLEAAESGLILPETPPVTRMSLFQVRALARFELGDLVAALRDIQEVEGHQVVFPNAQSAFYLRILQIRVQARARGIGTARAALDQLWKSSVVEGSLNLDSLQVLLRTEIDLGRLSGRAVHDFSLASWRVAHAEGDQLYSALAVLDAYFSSTGALQRQYEDQLSLSGDFERVRKLRDEVEQRTPTPSISTTALTTREWLAARSAQALAPRSPEAIRSLVIPKYSLVVCLSPWSVTFEPESRQLFGALSVLSSDPVAKEEFFRALWGKQKYTPRLHDPLIWNLCSRIRKRLGLSIETGEAGIELKGTLVLH